MLGYLRRHDLLDEHATADMLTWQAAGGFSIDASVRIEGHDRPGVERLVRYCARPPFALQRLHALDGNASLASPEARLIYRLPGPDVHGRTAPAAERRLAHPLSNTTSRARSLTPREAPYYSLP